MRAAAGAGRGRWQKAGVCSAHLHTETWAQRLRCTRPHAASAGRLPAACARMRVRVRVPAHQGASGMQPACWRLHARMHVAGAHGGASAAPPRHEGTRQNPRWRRTGWGSHTPRPRPRRSAPCMWGAHACGGVQRGGGGFDAALPAARRSLLAAGCWAGAQRELARTWLPSPARCAPRAGSPAGVARQACLYGLLLVGLRAGRRGCGRSTQHAAPRAHTMVGTSAMERPALRCSLDHAR